MMGRAKRAADRIRNEVPIIGVLSDYGYAVHPDGGDREQQFSCDLHGDGMDTKPSARVYPDSGSFHCFACGRSRDAITLVQEKEGIDFWKAVKALEARYGLPPLPWSAEDEAPKTVADQVGDALKRDLTYEDTAKRVRRFLATVASERTGSPRQLAGLWEAYDRVTFMHTEGDVSDAKAAALCLKVLDGAKGLAGVGR